LAAFVYVIFVDQTEKWAHTRYLSAVIAASQGGDVEPVDPVEERRQFDEWLRSVPDEAKEGDRSQKEKDLLAALFPRDAPVKL